MTEYQTVSAQVNTNQKQDLGTLKDISSNTSKYERNTSTMTRPRGNQMQDSTSCTSNELGTMTLNAKITYPMKDSSSEAKHEFEVGVMTYPKYNPTSITRTNTRIDSECNTQSLESEMGMMTLNCSDSVPKKDNECDAHQFENHAGSNTIPNSVKSHCCNTDMVDISRETMTHLT